MSDVKVDEIVKRKVRVRISVAKILDALNDPLLIFDNIEHNGETLSDIDAEDEIGINFSHHGDDDEDGTYD